MQNAADAAKARGNDFFKKGKYLAAVDAYTEAIALNPRVSVYYSNRAFALYKHDAAGRAEGIESDCRACLELDPRSAKGNYYLGKVLTARGDFKEGLRHFQRAYDIQPPFKADVRRALWQCKKELWQAQQPAKEAQSAYVLEHVIAGLERGRADTLSSCSTDQERATTQESFNKSLDSARKILGPSDPEAEVPQHLCCQITWAPLVDPVITPAGITYEKAVLLQHLHGGNHFEPVTREPLEESQLYPNKMIVDAVDAYIEEHPEVFFNAI